jgi:hypothetical protein
MDFYTNFTWPDAPLSGIAAPAAAAALYLAFVGLLSTMKVDEKNLNTLQANHNLIL